MKKKLILAAASTAVILLVIISNCTMAGAELGLVGTWKGAYTISQLSFSDNVTVVINQDDTGKVTTGSLSDTFTITKSDSGIKTITFKFKNSLSGSNGTCLYTLSNLNLNLDIKDFKISGYKTTLKLSK